MFNSSRLPESGLLDLPNGQRVQYFKDDTRYNLLHLWQASLTSDIPAGSIVVGEQVIPTPFTAVVREDAPMGSSQLTVLDSSQIPDTGVLIVPNGQRIDYSKDSVHQNLLYLAEPLASDIPAGTVVSDQEGTKLNAVGEGAGCTLGDGQARLKLPGLIVVGLLAAVAGKRRARKNARATRAARGHRAAA